MAIDLGAQDLNGIQRPFFSSKRTLRNLVSEPIEMKHLTELVGPETQNCCYAVSISSYRALEEKKKEEKKKRGKSDVPTYLPFWRAGAEAIFFGGCLLVGVF